ncbi:hypothetical protein HJG60_007760 [Phyllostomus discolor]|uniref:Uncharacterized protein n=1 Tax=Phyllostomus discolor TaxID=89673 RepID=A0A834BD04_9CHIR|nr:hypothetical protein HJG60_007760 [Phyllostomus discolor]
MRSPPQTCLPPLLIKTDTRGYRKDGDWDFFFFFNAIQQSESNGGRSYKEEKDAQAQGFLPPSRPDSARGSASRGTRQGPQALHPPLVRKDTHQGTQWRKQGAWSAAPRVPELGLSPSKAALFPGLGFLVCKTQAVPAQRLPRPLSALSFPRREVGN